MTALDYQPQYRQIEQPYASGSPRSGPASGRRIEATESRCVAERYGLDVQFEVEAPDLDRSNDAHR